MPPPARAVRPVSYLEAARAPLGIARSARSAPSVVRWSDLRAMTAAGRARPQPVERQQLEREYLPRQRAINITYSVVVPQAAAPPGPAVDIPPAHETIGEQLASTAAKVGRAAAGVAASHPVLTQADLDAATKRGEVVTQKQLTKAKKVAELSKLLAVLPLGALAKVCNASVTELAGMDADGLARHFVTRGRRSMWSVGQARDCRNTWARFMVYLDQRGVVHDGMSFKATDVGDFLEHVDQNARAKAPANRARALEKDAKAAAKARKEGRPPPKPCRWQDGSHAAEGVSSKLRSLRRNFFIDIPLEDAAINRQPGVKPSHPAPALSLGVIFALYSHVNRIAGLIEITEGGYEGMMRTRAGFQTIATAQVAAALLFAAFSCNRMEQANECAFLGEVVGPHNETFLHGAVLDDKHPDPTKKRARPFWLRVGGPDGKRRWFDFLKLTLRGCEDGNWVFRDYVCEGPGGADPGNAIRWLNSPLCGARLVSAIAHVIHTVCGIPLADAALFTKHSARHVLMEVASHRGESWLRQVEIGRWSGSTAQDPDLTPQQRVNWHHQLKAAVMPDNYAPMGKVQRVLGILNDQMDALGHLWHAWTRGEVELPVFGDFTAMRQWPAKRSNDNHEG